MNKFLLLLTLKLPKKKAAQANPNPCIWSVCLNDLMIMEKQTFSTSVWKRGVWFEGLSNLQKILW